MNDHPTNRPTPEDDLFNYAADPSHPTTGLEHTVSQVHRALTAGSYAMPTSIRDHIRQELMHSPTASTSGFASPPNATAPNASTMPIQRGAPPRSRFMAAIARWQPVVSMTIVVALLASVIALTYHRGVLDAPEGSGTFGAIQTEEEGDIRFHLDCTSQASEQLSDEELRNRTVTDFPIPTYGVAISWVGPPQTQVLQTFINFLACYTDRMSDPTREPSKEELSYYSDRLRFLLMYDELDPEQQSAIDTYLQRNPVSRIISDFPLPLNRYDAYLTSLDAEGTPFPEIFMHYDVYSIGLDRWVGVIGSVSTHMIQTGEPIRSNDGELTFVSFIQQGDAFVIDEFFQICPSDFAAELEPDTATPAASQAPFHPAQLLLEPGLSCS